MAPRRSRKIATGQTGMFTYVEATEKLWCVFCYSHQEVVDEDDDLVKLSCGHLTVRDASEVR